MIYGPCFDQGLTETLPVQSKMKYFHKELDSVKTVFCFYAASSFFSVLVLIFFFIKSVFLVGRNVISAFIKVAHNLNVCVVQMKE